MGLFLNGQEEKCEKRWKGKKKIRDDTKLGKEKEQRL